MDLDRYGGASRCLLRLRENEGKPGISDATFIREHLERHPEWTERPGEADLGTIFELAQELELGDGMNAYRDYARVLAEHRAGHNVLVATERPPQQVTTESSAQRYVMLLQTMDENSFTLWCPYPSGRDDVLLAVPRVWWDGWLCIGIVFRRVARGGTHVGALVP